MKLIAKQIFTAILAIIMLMAIPSTAISTEIPYDEESTETHSDAEQENELTADEALLADYLAGEVQYLTLDEHGKFLYNGKVIEFPPSYQCISLLRPEQDAVLTKGLSPELMTPLHTGNTPNNEMGRFAPRSAQMTADIQVFKSQISLGTSTGGWYQARMPAFTGQWFTVFCENINDPTPRPSEGHALNVIDYTEWYGENIRRALWFGYGGPGQDPALGGESGIIATTRVIGFFNDTQAPNQTHPASSSHSQIRRLYELATSSFTPPSNFRILWIDVHGSSQDLIFGVLDEQPTLGSFRILKTVPSGESSAGFQFDVTRDSDGFYIGRFTTNAAGNIYVSDLEAGNYTITEIVPSGWMLESQNPQTVTVMAGVTGASAPSRTFHNVRQTGEIIIRKSCSNAALRTHSMAGARFEIRNASNTVVATLTTNAAGTAIARDLQLGTYTVREITAPTGYMINTTTFTATISSTTLEVTVTVPQEPQRGRIAIQKTYSTEDNAFRTHNLAGAVFNVRADYAITRPDGTVIHANNALVATITTDANGWARTVDLPLGRYRVYEVTAPTAWQINNTVHTVTLSPQSQTVLRHDISQNHEQRAQRGRIAIQKTYPVGDNAFRTHNLAGAVFNVRADHAITRPDGTVIHANNALVTTITTDASGWARTADLPLGRYRIYEVTAPTAWQINNTVHTVTLSPQSQTVLRHDFTQNHEQRAQRGRIVVEKYITNPFYATYNMAGAVFNVRANSAISRPDGSVIFAANELVTTITTNASGRGESVDIPLGSYRVYEVTAPFGYQLNSSVFNVSLTPLAQSELRRIETIDVPQRSQTGRITVTKRDVITGSTAQGDATLEGAVFAIIAAEDIRRFPTNELIYRAGQEVQRLTVSGNPATAISHELPLGRYEVVEVVRPHGYMPDIPHSGGYFGKQNAWPMPWQRPDIENTAPTRWSVHITRPDQTVAIGHHSQTIENQVIEGRIWIIKHRSNDPQGSPHIERPLAGAIFRVFLTSAGSFENAQEMGLPHARIVTNDEGIAYTSYLPYGMYTVYEEYAPYDVELVSPFQVRVSQTENNPEQHRQTIRRILRNEMFKTWIQVNKVCATNGARIAAPGVPFRLFDVTNDRWMSFDVNYPTPHTISVFHTNDRGWFRLPDMLESGVYRLYEQAAPHGYLLNAEPLEFIVHSGMVDPEQHPIVLSVEFKNEPVFGQISIEKHGNMLVGVDRAQTEFGTLNTPVWEQRALPGVIFNIVAAEDIVTPCGIVRAYEGETVSTLVTDENGYAITSKLFLGRYFVVEIETQHGFVLDTTAHEVVLEYADQYTPLVFETTELVNERQRVSIELEKWMETLDEQSATYSNIVFGLFAYDNIYSADGELLVVGESVNEAENDDSGAEGLFVRFFGWVRAIFTAEPTSLVATFHVNGDGQAALSGEVPFGRYIVRELQTENGYRLTDAEFPVSFEYAGQEAALVTVEVNGSEPIHNYLKRGGLRVVKTFEGCEEPVAGVPFVFTGNTVVGMTLTIHAETDEDGMIWFDDLPVGEWTVTELEGESNRGFILSEPVTITIETDETSEVLIHNNKQRGNLRVLKTFEGRYEPVAGVAFLIAGDTITGDVVEFEAVTDESGEIFLEGLPVGDWTATEIEGSANRGFILSGSKAITVGVDEEAELKIHNYLMRGDIRIFKLCSVSGEPLEGAEFGLFTMSKDAVKKVDGNGEMSLHIVSPVTFVTSEISNEHGIASFAKVPFGDYFIRELEAPDGYILSSAFYEVSISEDGTVIEITIENTPEDDDKDEDVPRTGDETRLQWLSLFVSLAVIALCAITLHVLRKKNRNLENGDSDDTDS